MKAQNTKLKYTFVRLRRTKEPVCLFNVLELARIVGHRDLKNLQIYFNMTAEYMAKKLD